MDSADPKADDLLEDQGESICMIGSRRNSYVSHQVSTQILQLAKIAYPIERVDAEAKSQYLLADARAKLVYHTWAP